MISPPRRAKSANSAVPTVESSSPNVYSAMRDGLGFGPVLDPVVAVAEVARGPAYTEPILEAALAGIRPSR